MSDLMAAASRLVQAELEQLSTTLQAPLQPVGLLLEMAVRDPAGHQHRICLRLYRAADPIPPADLVGVAREMAGQN